MMLVVSPGRVLLLLVEDADGSSAVVVRVALVPPRTVLLSEKVASAGLHSSLTPAGLVLHPFALHLKKKISERAHRERNNAKKKIPKSEQNRNYSHIVTSDKH
jgi:hypothetical protein